MIQSLVPGGTGLLAELSEDRGAKLKQVLEGAHDAIHRCSCAARGAEVVACYRCLYAYREQRYLHLIDRHVALELLESMLQAFDDLQSSPTIGELSTASLLESELEERFRAVLLGLDEYEGIEVASLEGQRLRLRFGARAWRYEPQVTLKDDEVLHRCRPDFLLIPEGQEPEVRAVAGFADGVTFHVCPGEARGRLHDDFRKRAGIQSSERYLSWSFGWHDIDAYLGVDDVPAWIEHSKVVGGVKQLAHALELPFAEAALADPLRGLFAYLEEPRGWAPLAGCVVASCIKHLGKQATAGQARQEVEAHAEQLKPKTRMGLSPVDGDTPWALLAWGAQRQATCLFTVAKARAKHLNSEPDAVQGVLRLHDAADARRDKAFTTVWRQFLRAYNLLQFLPNLQVVTQEQLSGAVAELDVASAYKTSEPPVLQAAEPVDRGAFAGSSTLLALVQELPDVARPAVLAVAGLGFADLHVPYEMMGSLGAAGEIEAAWPAQRVGLFLEHQRETAEALRAAGWQLFQLEAGLDPAALERALRGDDP